MAGLTLAAGQAGAACSVQPPCVDEKDAATLATQPVTLYVTEDSLSILGVSFATLPELRDFLAKRKIEVLRVQRTGQISYERMGLIIYGLGRIGTDGKKVEIADIR